MKIAHIVWGLTTGGIETMLVNIANEQSALGHDVHVVVINNLIESNLVDAFSSRIKLHFICRKVGSKNPITAIRLNVLLAKLKADIYHMHALNMPKIVLRRFVEKSVTTLHTIFHDEDLRYVNKHRHICAISNTVAGDFEKRTGRKSTVVMNGINTTRISVKTSFYNGSGIFKIVQVGRLNHMVKGQHTLIEALKLLQNPKIKIDFVGDGPSFDYLVKLTKDSGLANQINFIGKKSQEYVLSHLKDYDLFVQPSLYEGFGLTVAEAMAAKLPILASDLDAMIEVTDNGRYGSIFKVGDAQSCADAIEKMIHTPDMTVIEAAFARARGLYNVKTTANCYLEEYFK